MPRDLIQHPDPLPIAHPDTVRAVCLRAAEIIEERGWSRTLPECPDGRVCMGKAILIAAGAPDGWDREILGRFAIALGLAPEFQIASGTHSGCLSLWNDYDAPHVGAVLALLRGTAGR